MTEAEATVIEVACDLVGLWLDPQIIGLKRDERNAAINDTRKRLIEAVGNLKNAGVAQR